MWLEATIQLAHMTDSQQQQPKLMVSLLCTPCMLPSYLMGCREHERYAKAATEAAEKMVRKAA